MQRGDTPRDGDSPANGTVSLGGPAPIGGDIVWGILLLSISAILVFPQTHELFLTATRTHPFLMGFIKVGILASMGELLARRIMTGNWDKPVGMGLRFFIWGMLGIVFVVVFELFAAGTAALLEKSFLPTLSGGFLGNLSRAFWTSALMNLIFAPVFMAVHRITDGFIEEGKGTISGIREVSVGLVVSKIDWQGFINFVVIRTIPFFWIPAHTITFLLQPEYRVLMASYLSIALGGILSFARIRQQKQAATFQAGST